MNEELKYCKNCNETFNGRSNKIFCNPKCKAEYHNRKYKSEQPFRLDKHKKEIILEHLNTMSQILLFDINKTQDSLLKKEKNNTYHIDDLFMLTKNHNLLSELRKIKSILTE